MSVVPTARPSSSRCGHSTSTGATARNSGPGKSALGPMPAWATASSAARLARRSESPVDVKGSTSRKSTVPAIVVRKPSVGKRVSVRMPDSPAVSFSQLSVLPAPSEVTTPIPVTTTIGRPNLSRAAVMLSPPFVPVRPASWLPESCLPESWLLDRLDQSHAFAPPVPGPDHHNLGRRLRHFNLHARGIAGRKQGAARHRQRRKAKSQRKLGLHGVAELRAGRAHDEFRMLGEEGAFLRGRRLGAGRAGDDGTAALGLADLRPEFFERRGDVAR